MNIKEKIAIWLINKLIEFTPNRVFYSSVLLSNIKASLRENRVSYVEEIDVEDVIKDVTQGALVLVASLSKSGVVIPKEDKLKIEVDDEVIRETNSYIIEIRNKE